MTKINPPMIARCSRLVVNSLGAVSPRSNQKGCPRSVAKTVKAGSKAAPRPAPTPETTVNPPMSWTTAAANIRERPASENLHRSRRCIRLIRANHGYRHHSDGFHRDGHRRDHGSLYGCSISPVTASPCVVAVYHRVIWASCPESGQQSRHDWASQPLAGSSHR
jgi:hypothetical protein